MARLTTHVLDTAQGRPAAGMRVELGRVRPDGGTQRIAAAVTNADGRTDKPLLEGAMLEAGSYELLFHVGAYFKAQRLAASEPPFLDAVPVRFSVADGRGNYHVPLLVSPWSYSTYRGS
jgi:hydroxyisourate hydrolase